jgi:hypothetical protein
LNDKIVFGQFIFFELIVRYLNGYVIGDETAPSNPPRKGGLFKSPLPGKIRGGFSVIFLIHQIVNRYLSIYLFP